MAEFAPGTKHSDNHCFSEAGGFCSNSPVDYDYEKDYEDKYEHQNAGLFATAYMSLLHAISCVTAVNMLE